MTNPTDLYLTTAVCSSRTGSVRVDNADAMEVPVTSPHVPDGWSAEQLYAAALATSLHEGLRQVAATDGELADRTVAATVSTRRDGDERTAVEARLKVRLPAVADAGRKREIVDLAASHAPLVGGWYITIA